MMLDCDEDVFLELVWKHKLQRVLRYLLHDLSNYLTGSLALSELYCDSSDVSTLNEGMIAVRDNCYKERNIFILLSQLIHPKLDVLNYMDIKSFLEELMPVFHCILPPQTNLSLEAQNVSSSVIRFKPEYLQRVFIQLICNAAEAIKSVISPKVSITCFLEGKNLICQMEDNGCGFDTENLKTIEQGPPRIQMIDESHLGLGLYMVRFYLSKMNCTMNIQSIEQSGTIISMKFPTLE